MQHELFFIIQFINFVRKAFTTESLMAIILTIYFTVTNVYIQHSTCLLFIIIFNKLATISLDNINLLKYVMVRASAFFVVLPECLLLMSIISVLLVTKWQLGADFSPRWHGFSSGPVQVRFVVGKVTHERFFSEYFGFTPK